MFKLLSTLLYFIRELIFDSSDEYSFNSPSFNSRKAMVFVIVTFSFAMNLFLLERTYYLATMNIELSLLKDYKITPDNCEKNIVPAPSDSKKSE